MSFSYWFLYEVLGMRVAEWLQIVVSFGLFYLGWQTLRLNRRQEELIKVQTRAFLAIRRLQSNPRGTDGRDSQNRPSVLVTLVLENMGRTQATEIELSYGTGFVAPTDEPFAPNRPEESVPCGDISPATENAINIWLPKPTMSSIHGSPSAPFLTGELRYFDGFERRVRPFAGIFVGYEQALRLPGELNRERNT